MTAPQHPQRCGTCECFEEVPQPRKYRCTWNCCFMHPADECICKPSHYKEANHSSSHSSSPAPVPEHVLSIYGEPAVIEDCPWCDGSGKRIRPINGTTRASQLPKIIPPLPEGDTTDLKVWKDYWKKHDEQIRQQAAEAARREVLESPEHPEGVTLKLCECGNDTFRFVETADYLPEYGTWEGDEVLRICTKCGKNHGCLADMKTGKSISRKALKSLRSGEGVQR